VPLTPKEKKGFEVRARGGLTTSGMVERTAEESLFHKE